METDAVIVVPCFNERARLRPEGFRELLRGARVLFVDDGSRDGTGDYLRELCEQFGPRAGVLALEKNSGKAEAVRRGLSAALASGAQIVGFLDADLATPAAEMLRIVAALRETRAQVALGARLKLLGARIERKWSRQILGRTFAAVASLVLGTRIRDTQCGAKAFRASEALTAALAEPFHARWAFDVELLGRLFSSGVSRDELVEVPLRAWREVAGSSLRPAHFPMLGLELLRIHFALAERRRLPRALLAQPKEHEDAA